MSSCKRSAKLPASLSGIQHSSGIGPDPTDRRTRRDIGAMEPACPLGQSVGPTPWDPVLSAAMDDHRLAVHEEAIVQELLHDLDER